MASDAVKAAWISGVLGAVGTIIAASLTHGFGLANSPSPSGSSSPVAVTTTAAAATTTPANVAGIPASYQGTWSGEVNQSNGVSYSLTLKIGSGSVGAVVGSWQVPTYGCSGELDLESGGGPLEMRQVTTFNPNLQCFTQFEISVALQGGNLEYEILAVTNTSGQSFSGNPFGTATLSP